PHSRPGRLDNPAGSCTRTGARRRTRRPRRSRRPRAQPAMEPGAPRNITSGGSRALCCAAMLIFVTGAAGFIGSHLSERLCARGDDVIGYDNFDPFYPRAEKEKNLAKLRSEPRFTFVEGDIRDADKLEQVFGDKHPEVVVHLAALAGVRP